MAPPVFNPEYLVGLIDDLREVLGFDVATGQYVAAQDLIVKLAAHGALPADPRELDIWLGPVLCASPEEQTTFHNYFRGWVAERLQLATTPEETAAAPGATAATAEKEFATTAAQTFRTRLANWLSSWRRASWKVWAGATAALLALAAAVSVAAVSVLLPEASLPSLSFISGQVVGEKSEPIKQATVSFSGQSMTTAADGEFLLASDVPETAAGQLLKISVKHPEYLPFGEELSAGTGGRTSNQGYSGADNVRQKFTGYERDGETGLDYAQARYYASTQGRFTSVDPQNAGADPEDPQSWNGYSYTGNNPLRRVDPTGMFWEELKNALKGRGWINNADFQKKVEEARKDITENFGIVRDGKYVPFDLNGLNDDQIIGLQTYLHQQSAAGNTINQGDAKPQGDALTPSSVGITVPGGSGPSTVGQGLKNVRDISSGRLKGYSRGNTEMPGGAQAAKDTFRQLTGRDPAGTFDRVVQGGKEVVYRASSKSGPSKVEVVDHAQKFVEKISFK